MENKETNGDVRLFRVLKLKLIAKSWGKMSWYSAGNSMTDYILYNKYEVRHNGKNSLRQWILKYLFPFRKKNLRL